MRIEDGGRNLVIDPGMWAEDVAFAGATGALITHEHHDHLDPEYDRIPVGESVTL